MREIFEKRKNDKNTFTNSKKKYLQMITIK